MKDNAIHILAPCRIQPGISKVTLFRNIRIEEGNLIWDNTTNTVETSP